MESGATPMAAHFLAPVIRNSNDWSEHTDPWHLEDKGIFAHPAHQSYMKVAPEIQAQLSTMLLKGREWC